MVPPVNVFNPAKINLPALFFITLPLPEIFPLKVASVD
jgi:hypothetical protein